MKKLALVLALLLVAAVGSVVKHRVSLKPATFKIGQERPWCTAFAISDTVAATAAHCVSDEQTMISAQISMFEQDNTPVGTVDVEISKHPALDVALVRGNFRNRLKLPVSSTRFELDPSDQYDSCGFPMMGKTLVCSHVFPKSMYAESGTVGVSGPGYLIFGMSGGPVFNLTTGHVVAVNTGLFDHEVILSPFVNIESYTMKPSIDMLMMKIMQGSILDTDILHLDMENTVQ